MSGADPRFEDPPGWILAVTREIWEGRGVASLRRHYAPDVLVRSPAGVTRGNAAVIAATLETLAELPDRRLLGEDVIWCASPAGGFLSSHRILSTATHAGHGRLGPPTGRRLVYRVIADCHAVDGRIDDEWLIRDQGAIVRQLGTDPESFARAQIAAEGGPARCARPLTPASDPPGPYRGRGEAGAWGARYADLLARIMAAELSAVAREYDRACELLLPGGITGHGRDAAERFWLGLRAAFPDARFEVHHAIGREDPLLPPRAALRWSLDGRHAGHGPFGPPSGAEVHVMGLCHAEFGPRGLRREFVLIDEVAIWKQILIARGAAAEAAPTAREGASP